MRREIRFSGYGGQGIALMAMLLGKAASVYDRKEAVLTQSYGPESRGGASNADVVVDDQHVDFPLVTRPDLLVVMFQEAYERFRPTLAKNGLLFLDERLVKPKPSDGAFFAIPATQIAEGLGKAIVANVVMLGFFAALGGVVKRQALEEAIKTTIRPKFVNLNLEAFAKGYDWARENVLVRARK